MRSVATAWSLSCLVSVVAQEPTDPDPLRAELHRSEPIGVLPAHGDHLVPGRAVPGRPLDPLIVTVPETSDGRIRPAVWLLTDEAGADLGGVLQLHGYLTLRLRRGSRPGLVDLVRTEFPRVARRAGMSEQELRDWKPLPWSADDLRAAQAFIEHRALEFGIDVEQISVIATGRYCEPVARVASAGSEAPAWSRLTLVEPIGLAAPPRPGQVLPPLLVLGSSEVEADRSLLEFVPLWERAGGRSEILLLPAAVGHAGIPEAYQDAVLRGHDCVDPRRADSVSSDFWAVMRHEARSIDRFPAIPESRLGGHWNAPGVRGVLVAVHGDFVLLRIDQAPFGVPSSVSLAVVDFEANRYLGEIRLDGLRAGFAIGRVTVRVPGARPSVGHSVVSDNY